MEWATKMYSPKRYLKDILVSRDDVIPISAEDTVESRVLRKCFIEYWYFAEIGFDFDDIFVQRVNTIWGQVKDKYIKLLTLSCDQLNGYRITKSGTDHTTLVRDSNERKSVVDGGTDTFNKQQGDKAYQRASQNSSIESTLNSTTAYGKTRDDVTTEEATDTTNLTIDRTDSNETFDSEKLMSYMKETSIHKAFVLEFSQCFMEVL